MFRNQPVGFIICLFPLFWPVLLAWRIYCISSKITITDNAIQYEKGLLSKTRIDLKIENIRTTKVAQGFMQRMTGAGDIEIYTAGDKPEIIIKGVRDPHQIRQLLADR